MNNLSENVIKLNKLCKTVTSSYRSCAQTSLSDDEISPTGMAVLTSLYYNPSGDTISSIANGIDVSKGLVSREVERLRKDGYITTDIDENDRRMVRLKLTDNSVDIVKDELRTLEKFTTEIICDISEEEFIAFMNTGRKIQEKINKYKFES